MTLHGASPPRFAFDYQRKMRWVLNGNEFKTRFMARLSLDENKKKMDRRKIKVDYELINSVWMLVSSPILVFSLVIMPVSCWNDP